VSWLDFLKEYAKVGTFVVGLFAVMVAIIAVWTNRRNAAETITIKLLQDSERDKELRAQYRLLFDARNRNRNMKPLAHPQTEDEKNEFSELTSLLNYYENMAIGARRGIYDLNTLRMAQRTIILHIWELLEGFILEMRAKHNNPHLYEHFEWLKECMRCDRIRFSCRWPFKRFMKHCRHSG